MKIVLRILIIAAAIAVVVGGTLLWARLGGTPGTVGRVEGDRGFPGGDGFRQPPAQGIFPAGNGFDGGRGFDGPRGFEGRGGINFFAAEGVVQNLLTISLLTAGGAAVLAIVKGLRRRPYRRRRKQEQVVMAEAGASD